MTPMMQTPWIALSERIYRALLIFYPADYRREYGALMVQVFRDVSRDTYRSEGWAGMAFWWCATFFDLVLTVFEQRRKVRFGMSKSMFVQLTGIFLIVGGLCTGIAAFSQFQPDNHYTYRGIYQVLIWLLAPGFLLTGLGCIGLALRYDRALGKVGQWTLYLSGFGALAMTVGVTATFIEDSLWDIWMAASILHTVALIAFGLLHLRKPVLPVFRALPLFIAGCWLVMWMGALRTSSQTANNTLSFLIVIGMGLAWFAIGFSVQRRQRGAALAAA